MVAMIADIARRQAVLNPQHGDRAHLHAGGVVLIDGLDLYLHPAWQGRVVADLARTFPRVQFIVTTHAPLVVSSVARSQVRILDRNRLVADVPHVHGRDADAILEDVFNVPARPEAVASEIDGLYRMINDGDPDGARRILADLEQRLGPDDQAIVRARWILDTEAGVQDPGADRGR